MKYINKKNCIGLFIAVIFLGLAMYSNCGGKATGTTGSKVTKKTAFVSVWQTTTPNETVTLPLRQGFQYSMTVNWGDDSPQQQITSSNDSNKTHAYAQAGHHTITLKGVAQAWYFNNSDDKDKILSVTDLGDMGWKSFENAFNGCSNLTTVKGGVTTNVTNMAGMFKAAFLADPDIGDWDTSNVTNMSFMFENTGASGPNTGTWDLSNWDTSNVINMSNMFSNLYHAVDLAGWDTSKVTDMSNMFVGAGINPNISHFNTTKVTDMSQMFYLSSVNPNMATWSFAKVADMNSMLVGSQISTLNYTKLLKRIHQTRTVNNVTLSATSQYYDSAATSRASLISSNGWSISDNGSAGPDPM